MTYDCARLINLISELDPRHAKEIYKAAYVWAHMMYEQGRRDTVQTTVNLWTEMNREHPN